MTRTEQPAPDTNRAAFEQSSGSSVSTVKSLVSPVNEMPVTCTSAPLLFVIDANCGGGVAAAAVFCGNGGVVGGAAGLGRAGDGQGAGKRLTRQRKAPPRPALANRKSPSTG